MRNLAIAGAGVSLAFAGVAAVFIVPGRMQVVWFIQSTGANEVVVPIGYWAAVALWTWLTARLTNVPVRAITGRAVCVGIALHILILLAAFTPRLGDPAAFSTSIYWIYARLFCAVVLGGGAAWATRRFRWAGGINSIEELTALPVLLGIVVFAMRFAQYDFSAAAAGLIAGLGIGVLSGTTGAAFGRLGALGRTVRRRLGDERLFLLFVFCLALALRIAYLRRIMTDPGYLDTGGDGATYDSLAWSIANGHGVPDDFRNGYPLLLLGYVWFVAAVYAIVGHSYFIIGTVQSVLGALACLFLFAAAKPLFGATVARVAAIFSALSFSLIFAAVAIGHQAADVFLTAVLVWMLLRAHQERSDGRLWWAGIGLVLGCAIAVRETSAFFAVFLFAWIALAFGRGRPISTVRRLAAMTIGALVVLTPLVLPSVSSTEGRLRLRQHFDRLYTGQGDAVRTRKELAGPLADPDAALEQLRQRPAFVVGTLGRAILNNFALQFFTQPFGGFDLVFLAKGTPYYYGVWFYAYSLTCAGIVFVVRAARSRSSQAAGIMLLLGLILFRTLPHLVLESHFRHRVPIEPFLILLASVASVGLIRAAARPHSPGVPA